jgi:aminoglycoside 6-adenylyltransferase
VKVDRFLEELTGWAAARRDVHGVVLVGSQARVESAADEYSDVDVALFVDDPSTLLGDTAWLRAFGEPLLTFLESTPVGGQVERRVLFDSGLEVDFSVFPADGIEAVAADPGAAATLARGYRILHDELGLSDRLAAATPPVQPAPELGDLAQDFWYHALWTAKKWRRGEALVARSCLESYLKPLLLEADRLRASGDTWHGTRFAERWAAPEVVSAWWSATARSPEELPAALVALCGAFAELAPGDPRVRARLEELLA